MGNTHEVVLKVTFTSEDMDGTTEETALLFDDILTREAVWTWEIENKGFIKRLFRHGID